MANVTRIHRPDDCPYCGRPKHDSPPLCPLVDSYEYDALGNIVRVNFIDPEYRADVLKESDGDATD